MRASLRAHAASGEALRKAAAAQHASILNKELARIPRVKLTDVFSRGDLGALGQFERRELEQELEAHESERAGGDSDATVQA